MGFRAGGRYSGGASGSVGSSWTERSSSIAPLSGSKSCSRAAGVGAGRRRLARRSVTASDPRWRVAASLVARSSAGRLRRSESPARIRSAAHTSASSPWPSGRLNRRMTISSAAHAPAAAITVPSPNGTWNSRFSARLRRRKRTDRPISTIAASTNENGPNVLTTSRSAPTPATRCSKFSRRQVSTTPSATRCGRSERLASAIARVGVVPEGDLVLALLPAEVDLAPVAQGREVHQSAVEVAQNDLHLLELAERALELEERLGHHAPGGAATVRGPGLGQRRARLLVA